MKNEKRRVAGSREAGVIGNDSEALTGLHKLVGLYLNAVRKIGAYLDDTHFLSNAGDVEEIRMKGEQTKLSRGSSG